MAESSAPQEGILPSGAPPENLDNRRRLDALQQAVESEQNAQAVNVLLEKYLENADITDGTLPRTLPADKMKEISLAFRTDQIGRLANIVFDAALKGELQKLAGEVTPSEKPDVALTQNTAKNPLLAKIQDALTKIMNHPTLQPLREKANSFGITDEAMTSGVMSLLSQVLLSVGKMVPAARTAAGEIAFSEIGESIAKDEGLTREQKQEFSLAFGSTEGRQKYMAAFNAWVMAGAAPDQKPGRDALLATKAVDAPQAPQTPQTQVASAPEKQAPTPAPAADRGEIVTEKRTVTLADKTTVDVTHSADKKTIVTVSDKKVAVAVANNETSNVFATDFKDASKKATVTFELKDGRFVSIDAEELKDKIQSKVPSFKTPEGITLELLDIKNT